MQNAFAEAGVRVDIAGWRLTRGPAQVGLYETELGTCVELLRRVGTPVACAESGVMSVHAITHVQGKLTRLGVRGSQVIATDGNGFVVPHRLSEPQPGWPDGSLDGDGILKPPANALAGLGVEFDLAGRELRRDNEPGLSTSEAETHVLIRLLMAWGRLVPRDELGASDLVVERLRRKLERLEVGGWDAIVSEPGGHYVPGHPGGRLLHRKGLTTDPGSRWTSWHGESTRLSSATADLLVRDLTGASRRASDTRLFTVRPRVESELRRMLGLLILDMPPRDLVIKRRAGECCVSLPRDPRFPECWGIEADREVPLVRINGREFPLERRLHQVVIRLIEAGGFPVDVASLIGAGEPGVESEGDLDALIAASPLAELVEQGPGVRRLAPERLWPELVFFRPLSLHPPTGELRRGDRTAYLSPESTLILAQLMRSPGATVATDALTREAGAPDRIGRPVADAPPTPIALRTRISRLNKVLSEELGIHGVAKRGARCRLVVDRAEAEGGSMGPSDT